MESYLRYKRKMASVMILALVSCMITFGIIGAVLSRASSGVISNIGSVKGTGVGIYWNTMCTNRASSINWGSLDPGSIKTVTLYVRNEGNAAVTLSKTVQNWTPSTASSCISLSWNYAGQTINPNQVLQVPLALTVSSTASGITNFAFDISITATG